MEDTQAYQAAIVCLFGIVIKMFQESRDRERALMEQVIPIVIAYEQSLEALADLAERLIGKVS
jgi:hypothetical protein